jgi:hypothetical protein
MFRWIVVCRLFIDFICDIRWYNFSRVPRTTETCGNPHDSYLAFYLTSAIRTINAFRDRVCVPDTRPTPIMYDDHLRNELFEWLTQSMSDSYVLFSCVFLIVCFILFDVLGFKTLRTRVTSLLSSNTLHERTKRILVTVLQH